MHWVRLVSVAAVLCATATAAVAQTVPVRTIGGVVVARGTLRSPGGNVPAHFVIDLGSADGLTLPPDRAGQLGLTAGGTCTVEIGGTVLENVPVNEADRAEMVRQLTTERAAELEQVPAAGVIGLGALGGKAVELEITGRTLKIGADADAGKIAVDLHADRTHPTFDADGAKVGLGMLTYESQASPAAASRLKVGRAGAAKVMLGEVDLLAGDAYRIAPMDHVAEPRPDLVLGVRLLSHFRIVADPAARRLSFDVLRLPTAPAGEQDYFLAAERRDAAGIAAFIENRPDSRLVTEAARGLLELRINDPLAGDAGVDQAIRLMAKSFPQDRRAHRMVALVDDLMASGDGRFVDAAGRMLAVASESAKDDLDAKAVYEIHARQGLIALRAGDLREARRRLISAAFGMPADPRVNVWLGDLYHRDGEPRRAWARYLEAAVVPNPPAAALRALDGLHREVPVAEAELMLEGRVPAFAPARQRSQSEAPGVRVVELFASDSGGGSVGQQLAFDGLREFWRGTPVMFLAYHFGPAGNTALSSTRAKFYGLKSLPMVAADGETIGSTPAEASEAAALFEQYAMRTTAVDTPATSPVRLSVRRGTDLSATITVEGTAPADANLRVIAFVVEQRVFAVGGSGTVLHYAVARAALGDPQGLAVDPARGRQEWTVKTTADELKRTAEGEAERARAASAEGAAISMRTTIPNLAECNIVAVLQDVGTRKVWAAATTATPAAAASGGTP